MYLRWAGGLRDSSLPTLQWLITAILLPSMCEAISKVSVDDSPNLAGEVPLHFKLI